MFAEPYKEIIRANAEIIAKENRLKIEFVPNTNIRKEAIVPEKIKQRGNHPGIVHIISAVDACPSYKPWHDNEKEKHF